jgi:hypothetical protein
MISTYLSYWKTYIQPIEEEKRRVQFNDTLIDVGLRLYGVEFALEFTFLILQEQNPQYSAESVSDTTIPS